MHDLICLAKGDPKTLCAFVFARLSAGKYGMQGFQITYGS